MPKLITPLDPNVPNQFCIHDKDNYSWQITLYSYDSERTLWTHMRSQLRNLPLIILHREEEKQTHLNSITLTINLGVTSSVKLPAYFVFCTKCSRVSQRE